MAIDTIGNAWGHKGTPLLPETLREAWCEERLPDWIARDVGLPDDATYADLGFDVWSTASTAPERVLNALTILLGQRADQIAEVWCVKDPWPLGLKPDSVPWTTRTRNTLKRAGLYSPDQVNTNVTFGQLMKTEGAGVRTALDFAATLEAAMRQFEEARTTAAALPRKGSELLEAAEEAWTAQVSAEDPRFLQALMAVRGQSFRDYIHNLLDTPDVTGKANEIAELIARLPEVRKRVKEIEQETLEQALSELLKRIVQGQERQAALSNRLGWHGKPPKTLEEVGQQVGVTRERIRQIESKALRRLPESHPTFLPALDLALKAVTEAAPIAAKDVAALTVKVGASRMGFHPEALFATAQALGHEHALQFEVVKNTKFVTTQSDNPQVRVLSTTARKLAGGNGAFSVYHAKRECARLGANFDENQIRDLLSGLPIFLSLDEERDWWRARDLPEGRDRLVNLAKKMLSVASPVSVRTLREGIFRVFKWRMSTNNRYRNGLITPPVSVLIAFFRNHDEFTIEGEMVSSKTPLDYKELLGDAERALVEILRASATGVLDRATLTREAISRGVSEATFNVLSSFAPILERVGLGVWKIRGVMVHPAAVEAVRQHIRDTPRERRILNHGWTSDGRVWLAVKAPHPPRSMVIGIPSALEPFLGGKRFEATMDDGVPCGTLASTEHSTLYGFYTFARAVALEEGDVVKMTFDFAKGAVVLEVVDEDALEE